MDIICLGQITADVVVNWIGKIPEKGKSKFVKKIQLHNGGCACNTAIDLAKIGVDVGIIGRVGTDGFGDFLVSLMKSKGVKIEGIKRTPQVNTSSTVVLVDPDGERSFLHYSGANAKLKVEDIDFEIIKRAKILHLAPIGLLPSLEGKLEIPAFPVQVVDTTGAGDGFAAGFLTGIVKGWGLKKSGVFANAVGACIVGEIGASTGVKDLQKTIESISNQKNSIVK